MEITRLMPDAEGNVAWPTLSGDRRSVVSVGVFDGFHLGHRAVIERVVELAKRHNAVSIVILFDPRPAFVHGYAAAHEGAEPEAGLADAQELTGADERLRLIGEMGVDRAYVVRYTLPFAAKTYRFFLGQMVGKVGMRTLVLGMDAALGCGCEGNVKAIANLAAATGVFELEVVDDRGPGAVRVPKRLEESVPDMGVEVPDKPGDPADPLEGLNKAERRAWSKRHGAREVRAWSSTNVRWLLAQGRVEAAASILGRLHAIEGEVVHGEQRGRTIGFPTANLGGAMHGYVPADGVYAGWLVDLGPETDANGGASAVTEAAAEATAKTEVAEATAATVATVGTSGMPAAVSSSRRWPAAISIGTKPTFNEVTGLKERVVEANAIVSDGTAVGSESAETEWLDLYGHHVRIEFQTFLRPQVKFDGVEALTAELARNVAQTRELCH